MTEAGKYDHKKHDVRCMRSGECYRGELFMGEGSRVNGYGRDMVVEDGRRLGRAGE